MYKIGLCSPLAMLDGSRFSCHATIIEHEMELMSIAKKIKTSTTFLNRLVKLKNPVVLATSMSRFIAELRKMRKFDIR